MAIEEQNKIQDEIRKIIDSNCEEVPYEGTVVDKTTMTYEIVNYIKTLKL